MFPCVTISTPRPDYWTHTLKRGVQREYLMYGNSLFLNISIKAIDFFFQAWHERYHKREPPQPPRQRVLKCSFTVLVRDMIWWWSFFHEDNYFLCSLIISFFLANPACIVILQKFLISPNLNKVMRSFFRPYHNAFTVHKMGKFGLKWSFFGGYIFDLWFILA